MPLRVPAPTPTYDLMSLMPGAPPQPFSLSNVPSNGTQAQMLPSQRSDALPPDVEKAETVYQQTQRASRKRKTAPQKSLSKNSSPAPKVEFAVPPPLARRAVVSSVPTKDALVLKEAVQMAEKKYQTDFKSALQAIDAILCKTDIFISGNKIFSKASLQEEHLQLLKIKGLCLVEAVKEDISLESSMKIHVALSILVPLQSYKAEDFEIQKAVAFCYSSLALCPSQKNQKIAHQLKADEAFKKAHDLCPADLSIIQDWFGLKLQLGKYIEALQILATIQSSLAECQDKSILIPLLKCETLCCIFLAKDKTEKLRDHYREQAQRSFKKLENIVGPEDHEIRHFRTSYPDIFQNL